VGARTDAARAEVVARRQLLLDEVVRLEAAGRSAIDIRAKIRHAPGKTAALAAGTAFMILGGPKRTYRAVRRIFLGPRANLPESMLPRQVDKALRSLGDDGNAVRGVLEREFADYLEKNKQARESRALRGTLSELGGNLLRPATAQIGKRLASDLFKPEGGSFRAMVDRIQARRDARRAEEEGQPVDGVAAPAEPEPPSRRAWRLGVGRKGPRRR
jgi:hypothetical protein